MRIISVSLALGVAHLSGCIVDLGGPDEESCADPIANTEDPALPGVGRDPISPPIALLDDDAGLVASSLPSTLACGESFLAAVTVKNTGKLTWTPGAYSLGAVDDSDPFAGTNRIPLTTEVAPGGEVTFAFDLTAPLGPVGVTTYTSDWQMVHEFVTWFGDTASVTLDITCEGLPPPENTLPDMSDVVDAVAAAHPDLLAASCVDDGGNNDFLHAVVDELRLIDTRWGYNWKRGNVGDLSQDVVDYYYGDGAADPEGSTDVFIVDVIAGHCGPTPGPAWIDVTQATLDGGTIGRWTSLDRF